MSKKTVAFIIGAGGLVAVLGVAYFAGPYRARTSTVPGTTQQVADSHGASEHDETPDHDQPDQGLRLNDEAAGRIGLKVVPAARRPIEQIVRATGVISPQPNREATVASRVQGKVETIYVNLGQRVEKGQRLADLQSLEMENLQVELVSASSNLTVLKKDRERVEVLVQKGIAASKELYRIESDYRKAESEVRGVQRKLALLGLSDREISDIGERGAFLSVLPVVAPIDGQIVERHVAVGETVEPNHAMFLLLDSSVVVAESDVPEDQIGRIRKGQLMRIRVSDRPDRMFEGRVGFISDVVDPQKRTVHVWAEVPNPDLQLKTGMFADMAFVVGAEQQALTIPLDAVLTEQGESFVFVQEGDRYRRVDVSLGARDDRFVEVTKGLAEGDKVVTAGNRQLYTQSLLAARGGAALGGHTH